MIHLDKACPSPRVRWFRCFRSGAFWVSGFLIQTGVAGMNEAGEDILDLVLSAEIRCPKVFSYKPSERDPFLDASVKLTLLSGKEEVPGFNDDSGLDQFSRELSSELLQRYRINGVVCGQRGSVVLIGKRVLYVGDVLELALGEELVRKIRTVEESGSRKFREVLSHGTLLLRVESITPSAIWLIHDLLEHPLSLPYSKNTFPNATQQTTSTRK